MKNRRKNRITVQRCVLPSFRIEALEMRQLLTGSTFTFPTYSTGPTTALATADLNGDGYADIITAGEGSSPSANIIIRFGKGDGTFGVADSVALPAVPGLITTSDYNGDGKVDLLMGAYSSAMLLINNGDGTFASPVNIPIASTVQSIVAVAMGDLNGDGITDVVLGGSSGTFGTAFINVDLATSPGVFAAPVKYFVNLSAASQTLTSIAIGDVNGDGKRDIVASSQSNGGPVTRINVYINQGLGAFAAAVAYGYTGGEARVALMDLTGDGFPDIVAPNGYSGGFYNGGGSSNLYVTSGNAILDVLINKGDGTFAAAVPYGKTTGSQDAQSMSLVDINHDGNLDFVGGSYSRQAVVVMMNQGNGVFGSPIYSGLPASGFVAAPADFNGDGMIDVAITSGTNTLLILPGNGDGTFGQKQIARTAPGVTFTSAVADINNDNHPDLLVALSSAPSAVSVYQNLGDGTFAAPISYPLDVNPLVFSAFDFNSDGWLDLLGVDASGSISVLLNNQDGTFAPPATYSSGLAMTTAVSGDLNGDGKPDLVLANGSSNSISVFLNDSPGGFASPVIYSLPNAVTQVFVTDLDNDGHADVVAQADTPFVLYGDGTGAFASPIAYTSLSYCGFVQIADINGDHLPDTLAAQDNIGGNEPIEVILNTSSRTYASAVSYAFSFDDLYIPFTVTDVSGDGKPDVFGAGTLINNGNGTFSPKVSIGSTSAYSFGDFNGDGLPDFVSGTQSLSVYFGTGVATAPFALSGTYQSGLGNGPTYVGDFNSDGRPDVLAVHTVTTDAPYSFATLHLDQPVSSPADFSALQNRVLRISSPDATGAISIAQSNGNYIISEPGRTMTWPVANVDSIRMVSPSFTATTGIDAPILLTYSTATFTEQAGGLTIASNPGGWGIRQLPITETMSSGTTLTFAAAASISDRTLLILPSTFTLPTGSRMDVGNDDLIINSSSVSLPAIQALIKSGFANGSWLGTGITSSAAMNDPFYLHTLAAVTNNKGTGPLLSTFDGYATTNRSATLVKYTYYGDADLNGKVDGNDYTAIDNGRLHSLTGWINGDFNYDGKVDGSDYTLIDNAFNRQSTVASAVTASAISPSPSTKSMMNPSTFVFQSANSAVTKEKLSEVKELIEGQRYIG